MSDAGIPPPPPGFVLDRPGAGAIPPPPPGFVLDKPAAPTEGPSRLERFGMGVADPAVGMGQAAAHLGVVTPEAGMPEGSFAGAPGVMEPLVPTADVDKTVQQREQSYQAERKAGGQTGTDWMRIGGNIASPANAPLMAVPELGLGRLFTAALRGGAQGAGAAMMEPVTSGDYGTGKAEQALGGAVVGAPLGAAGKLAEPLLQKGEEGLAWLFNQAKTGVSGALRDTRGGVDIPIGGGKVEPAPPSPPKGPPPNFPQPPGGIPMETGAVVRQPIPGAPAPPGGVIGPPPPAAPPPKPIPNFPQPPGGIPMQTGAVVRTPRPGQPATPGGRAGPPPPPAPPIPEFRQSGVPLDTGAVVRTPRPGTPAPPGGKVEMAPPSRPSSSLGNAIADNDSNAVDRAMVRAYRRVIDPAKPTGSGSAGKALNTQNLKIMTGLDEIINNRAEVPLNLGGVELTGRVPRSIAQLDDAIDKNLKLLYPKYSGAAKQAGDAGLMIDMQPAIDMMNGIADKAAVKQLHPELTAKVKQLANTWADYNGGKMHPSELEEVIQNMTGSIKSFWKNPQNELVNPASVWAPLSAKLRDMLDKGIEGATGAEYQAIRTKYSALRAMQDDVRNAMLKKRNQIPENTIDELTNLGAGEMILHGILHPQSGIAATGAALKAGRMMQNFYNSPNRAIARMFDQRMRTMSGIGPAFSPRAFPVMGGAVTGRGIGSLRSDQYP